MYYGFTVFHCVPTKPLLATSNSFRLPFHFHHHLLHGSTIGHRTNIPETREVKQLAHDLASVVEMSKSWKETLEQQQNELERLEALDAGLTDATLAIDKALRRPKSASKLLPARQRLLESNRRRHSSVETATHRLAEGSADPDDQFDTDKIELDPLNQHQSKGQPQPEVAFDTYSDIPLDNGIGDGTPKAPETTIR